MIIPAVKANGNLNSFIIIDKKDIPHIELNKSTIKKISIYHENSCVDGVVIVQKNSKKKYKVDYYNNDGTWETLCVNSLRCVGLLLFEKYNIQNISLDCGDGTHNVYVKDNNITVDMNKPEYKSKKIEINRYKGYYLFSGAKHFVINYLDNWPENEELKKIAQKIRYDKYFSEGVNVNFFKYNNNNLDVITYEKGIEKIMPSCASGSFACAYHCIFNNKIKNKDIYITNPSGELFAHIDVEKNRFHISGTATIEKEIEILI